MAARNELIEKLSLYCTKLSSGFLRVLLISANETVQLLARKLQNYSSCTLRGKVCINCTARFQGSVQRATSLAQTITGKLFD